MENITIQDILDATGGTLLCGDPSMKIDHLSTNSMEVGPNTLFVPIIGERVDAHVFIPVSYTHLDVYKRQAYCLGNTTTSTVPLKSSSVINAMF